MVTKAAKSGRNGRIKTKTNKEGQQLCLQIFPTPMGLVSTVVKLPIPVTQQQELAPTSTPASQNLTPPVRNASRG